MKTEHTPAITVLLALMALASCSGDENPSTKSTSKEARSSTYSSADKKPESQTPPPPVADASEATRQPVTPVPAASPLSRAPEMPAAEPPVAEPLAPEPVTPEVADDEAPLLSPEEAAIPTQEEADLEATQSINEENADEELQKLEQELGSEGGG